MQKLILTDETSILSTLEFKKVWIEEIKQELQKNVEFSKNLTITDFEDKKQIESVKSTKNWYVKTRNTIKRAFKSKRDEYNFLAKENLEAEREVIAVIEWEEKRLDELVEKAEKMKLRKENELKLEDRRNLLNQYETIITDDELLEMLDKDFNLILSTKKEIYLAKKEAELKAEQERINREKEIEEAKKQARLEAEKESQRQAELERQKVEREKQEAEQRRLQDLENARIEKENEIKRIKKEQEEKELAEKKRKEDEERARLEAEKQQIKEKELAEKRQEFIKYRDSIDFDHFEDKDGFRIFYKKVWEFKLN